MGIWRMMEVLGKEQLTTATRRHSEKAKQCNLSSFRRVAVSPWLIALALITPLITPSPAFAFTETPQQHAARIRNDEIATCRPAEIITWPDGKDRPAVVRPMRFAYNPAGAPAEMTETLTTALLTQAIAGWSGCGVGGELIPWRGAMEHRPDVVTVIWSDTESRNNFGLTNFGRRQLALGPGAFRLLRTRNPQHDFRETMQMVIAHEMGHLYGLMAHSRRCVDVTSYYDNGRGEQCVTSNPTGRSGFAEYRHTLPTACDIQRCRRINGLTP
jgi:hypothetical protein